MWLAWIFGIDQNVIQIHNKKNIQLFSQNHIDVFLEGGWSIKMTKKYDLIFEIAILDLESSLSFITPMNLYLMIGIGEI